MGGDSKMTEEEYAEERYRRDQLRPETGGRGTILWWGALVCCCRGRVEGPVSWLK